MVKITLKKFVELNKMDREIAYGIFKYLRSIKVLKEDGKVPRPEGEKGRPEIIFAGDPEKIQEALGKLRFE